MSGAGSGRAGPLTLARLGWRDLAPRGRGLRLLLLCLVLGVATLAAIGGLTRSITAELGSRGQVILGGDLEFGLSQRLATAPELAALQAAANGGGTLSSTVRMRAMARVDGDAATSVLTELKAVDAAYPLYGTMELASESGRVAASEPPRPGAIWVAPELADRLGVGVGDTIRYGEAAFTIAAVIASEPDRLGEGFTLGPVAIIGLDALPATRLIQPGSMFDAKYRLRLPPGADLGAVRAAVETATPGAGWDIEDRSNGAPGTRRFIERMGQFLALVGLAALVIAGIGVGNGVASYLAAKRPQLATMKVLGADSTAILTIYGAQIAAVAAIGITIGLALGIAAVPVIGWIAGDLLPVQAGFRLHPAPLALAGAFGALITLAFAWPPLAATRRVGAAGIYRAQIAGTGSVDWASTGVAAGALAVIAALAIATARDPLFAAMFIAATAVLLGLLSLIGRAVVAGSARLPRPRRPIARLALAALHRPGNATGALVVALGLGLTMFVTLAAIQTSITGEITRTVPQRAPSFFVLDIPRDGAARFRTMVDDAVRGAGAAPAASDINIIPALRGRITAFGGTRVDEMATLPDGAWVLRGDRGLTYSGPMPPGSVVTAGRWWPADYAGPPLVSMETEAAASLGVGVGDAISVNVLGVEVAARIASLRTVEWENFGLNYVLVFSPGTFDAAPHNLVATLTLPPAAERTLARSIPAAFPSASLIATRDVVVQIGGLLSQMARAIAAAASIVILAGIAVLVGAIAASRERRMTDSIILKLLGASRRQILAAQTIEYLALALLLAVLALGVGLGAAWLVVVQLFEFRFGPDPVVVGAALLGGAVITFAIGMVGSLPVLAARPAAALRSG